MVLLGYKSRDGGERTQMEGKAQVAAFITSLTEVGVFCQGNGWQGVSRMYVGESVAQQHYIYHFRSYKSPLRHPDVLKYAMHALRLAYNKAQIVYLCFSTKTHSENTADGFSVKNHQPLRFQKCIFSNSMPIFI